MKYFLGLSANYTKMDVLNHVLSYGSEYDLSELRAFLAARYGATYDHTAVYANGRTALNVALKAITKRGGRVVITSLTCYAVVQAVKAAGCVPIFADVDPKTLHFGKKELEKAIEGENNVQAVIVQNNLGIPADIVGIEEVAKKNKITIIEDLAHCAGVKYDDGREAGTVGRAVVLSFGKGKSIDTVTGGAVVFTDSLDTPVAQPTNTPKLKDNARARLYPLFGLIIRGLYNIHPKAGKYLTSALVRLGAIKRSADGDINPKIRLTYWQCRRALSQLQSLPHSGRKPIRDFYLVNDRESVLRKFELDGYFFDDIWYDMPVIPERYYRKADFHPDECPVAAKLAKQIVNLPTNYTSAEMKSALKIIERYSAEDTKFEELKDEDNLTEAEKKAKIKAEKKAKAKAKRSEKFSASKKYKEAKKELKEKLKKEGGNFAEGKNDPENTEGTEGTENTENTKSPEKAAKKVIEKAAKIAKKGESKKKDKDVEKEQQKKEKEALSALEEKSSLLDAMADKKEAADKPNKKEAADQFDKKDSTDKPTKKEEKTPVSDSATEPAIEPKTAPKKEPVMRVAPKKLTEREKLKLELENGRKDGPSVL